MIAPGAVVTYKWAQFSSALLVSFFGGEQFAPAIFNIIDGHVNPSGKLPITFPNYDNEANFGEHQYPGVNKTATYTEGLFIGYRYYDRNGIIPAFPFGYGLSYTNFEYIKDSMNIDRNRRVTIVVKNTGKTFGKEVV